MNNKEKEEQLRNKVFNQVMMEVRNQVCDQAQFQIRDQVETQTFNQIRFLLDVSIDDQIHSLLCSQITSERRNKQERENEMKNKWRNIVKQWWPMGIYLLVCLGWIVWSCYDSLAGIFWPVLAIASFPIMLSCKAKERSKWLK